MFLQNYLEVFVAGGGLLVCGIRSLDSITVLLLKSWLLITVLYQFPSFANQFAYIPIFALYRKKPESSE
uniref:Uncharacterized protein n=1 Tax=Tolypothrix bouteillei VB521301 TaxID=1479485 RepID=A0A0C1N939_9CYAN